MEYSDAVLAMAIYRLITTDARASGMATHEETGQRVRAGLSEAAPVVRWRGPARPAGKTATLLVVGEEPWVNYLPERFFADVPQKEFTSHTTIWRLPALLEKLQSSVDLVVMRVDRVAARAFFGTPYLSVPQWIGASLKVPADPAVLVRASKNLREDMRRARHHRLQTVVRMTRPISRRSTRPCTCPTPATGMENKPG